MSERVEFTAALRTAVEKKTEWFDTAELPELLENYRLLHTCVRNIYDLLLKRSAITPDPYKLEKKITSIEIPDESTFSESDTSVILGARFSDYESMLDYLCTYFKFSSDSISLATIKKLNELNNAFQWTNMSVNNSKTNTKALAALISEVRRNLPVLSQSMITDSISKSGRACSEITRILKELSEFKREEYKLTVRTKVLGNPSFDWNKAKDGTEEIAEIKRIFVQSLGKTPYYSELIQEISDEDFSSKKDEFQAKALFSLEVKAPEVKKKKETVDTKAFLMETIRTLSLLSPEYASIAEKLNENNRILEKSKTTVFKKLMKKIRKAFNIKEPPVIFRIVIVDQQKQTKQARDIDINVFISNLERKSNFMSVIGNSASAEHKRIESSSEEQILQFVNKQISDNSETNVLLGAIDEYFKTNCAAQDRSKIKGLKIDLVSVKNILVKANTKRSEYVSYIEEREQMRKMGISDDE